MGYSVPASAHQLAAGHRPAQGAAGAGSRAGSEFMTGFLLRALISAIGLWLASVWVTGVRIHGPGTLLPAAVLPGVVNDPQSTSLNSSHSQISDAGIFLKKNL